MNPIALAAIVSRLRAAQEDFEKAAPQHKNLFHAVIDGFAVHDDQWIREYLKRVIADGPIHQPRTGKVSTPCGFFFGKDVRAAEVFDRLATPVVNIISGGADPDEDPGRSAASQFSLPPVPDPLADYGDGGVLMWWIYWLGQTYSVPLLIPKRGRLRFDRQIVHPLTGDPIEQPTIWLPDGRSVDGTPAKYRAALDELEDFGGLCEAVQKGDIGEVLIYRRSVWEAASIGVGVLIDHIQSTLPTSVTTNPIKTVPAASPPKKAKGDWTKEKLSTYLRGLRASDPYRVILRGVIEGKPGAIKAAGKYRCREFAAELGCGASTLSGNPVWQEIADELGLPRGRAGGAKKRTGFAIAAEDAAEAAESGDPLDEMAVREIEEKARNMTPREKERLASELLDGKWPKKRRRS